jgi:hypothetical protein
MTASYFRALAARCWTASRESFDLFAKEEFRHLATSTATRVLVDAMKKPGQALDLRDRLRSGGQPWPRRDACWHQPIIDVSKYRDDLEVLSFQRRAKCGKCGSRHGRLA